MQTIAFSSGVKLLIIEGQETEIGVYIVWKLAHPNKITVYEQSRKVFMYSSNGSTEGGRDRAETELALDMQYEVQSTNVPILSRYNPSFNKIWYEGSEVTNFKYL